MGFEYYALLIGMAVVTYLPRSVPLALLASRPLNSVLTRWLSFVPAAVLSALLLPELFTRDQSLFVSTGNTLLLATVPTVLVAVLTRSFFGTVLAGMATTAILRQLM